MGIANHVEFVHHDGAELSGEVLLQQPGDEAVGLLDGADGYIGGRKPPRRGSALP